MIIKELTIAKRLKVNIGNFQSVDIEHSITFAAEPEDGGYVYFQEAATRACNEHLRNELTLIGVPEKDWGKFGL